MLQAQLRGVLGRRRAQELCVLEVARLRIACEAQWALLGVSCLYVLRFPSPEEERERQQAESPRSLLAAARQTCHHTAPCSIPLACFPPSPQAPRRPASLPVFQALARVCPHGLGRPKRVLMSPRKER